MRVFLEAMKIFNEEIQIQTGLFDEHEAVNKLNARLFDKLHPTDYTYSSVSMRSESKHGSYVPCMNGTVSALITLFM
jgi:hypothetical protein